MDVVEETIETYDRIAPDYCRKTQQTKFLEWEENYIKRLLVFTSKSDPLILDVGCGDGRHSILIERHGGRAIGIDLSKNMIEEARALYPDGDFRKMDMPGYFLTMISLTGYGQAAPFTMLQNPMPRK